MGAQPAVQVEGLTKEYGRRRALRGIGFQVERGEVFALLGPNGAGKTTTVEILTGQRHRTAGTALVLGRDPWREGPALRQQVGVVLQSAGIDADLTVGETVRLYAGLHRRPRPTAEVLELVGLGDRDGDRARVLSGGQLRRLDLALALVGRPVLLFLDEPTTGLDPFSRREAWDLVAGLRAGGTTVLLTSHYMDEVQYLADRVAVLSHGEIVAEATPSTLAGRDLALATITFRDPGAGWEEAVTPGSPAAERHGDVVVLTSTEPTPLLAALTSWAVARGEELVGITVTRPTLEDAYLGLVERRVAPR